MNEIKIDKDLLDRGKSRNGSWSRKQLSLLGVKWPLKSGWSRRMIGEIIPSKDAQEFIELKDKHLGIPKEPRPAFQFKYCPHCGGKLPKINNHA